MVLSLPDGLRIYTVGHSARELSQLISILKAYGVEVLVDVRRFPRSRKNPQFNRELLEAELARAGIRYYWLGSLLGGFRRGGYKEYTKTDSYRQGIRELIEISKLGTTALMCAEALWFRCHRRYISDTLSSMGIEVVHIISESRAYRHKPRGELSKGSRSLEEWQQARGGP